MSTNLFPQIARDWINKLRGKPPKSSSERIVDTAANKGDASGTATNESSEDVVREAAEENDPNARH